MLSFYDGFFLNLCVLISSLFVYKVIIKKSLIEKEVTVPPIIEGLTCGLLAFVLMHYSIDTGLESIIDFRIIPLMLMVLYGNTLSTAITACVIILARFMIGGGTQSLINIIFVLGSWVIFHYCSKLIKKRRNSVVVMLTLSNILYLLLLFSSPVSKASNFIYVLNYWVICIVGGVCSVYIMDYMNKVEILFKESNNKALTDSLTGLNNVRSFNLAFSEFKTKQVNLDETFSIMLIDIDHFKEVNDTYGHLEGDAVLRKLSAILKMNKAPGDVVSRNGGEEFTILLHDYNPQEVYQRAEALRKVVESSFFVIKNGRLSITVTISIGVAVYKGIGKEINNLYAHADEALYEAKKSRNKVCCYSNLSTESF